MKQKLEYMMKHYLLVMYEGYSDSIQDENDVDYIEQSAKDLIGLCRTWHTCRKFDEDKFMQQALNLEGYAKCNAAFKSLDDQGEAKCEPEKYLDLNKLDENSNMILGDLVVGRLNKIKDLAKKLSVCKTIAEYLEVQEGLEYFAGAIIREVSKYVSNRHL